MKTVLFLCTGNYYRSRFAEELFNYHAIREGLPWSADSRALAIERGKYNIGPISPFTLEALRQRAVLPKRHDRFPQPCVEGDLASADCVIAVHEVEHRTLIQERFPQWESRIRYWNIPDVEYEKPETALAALDKQIELLATKLKVAIGN
jgi:low molecular weight protein-tyrosine phosphatase